MPRIAEIIGPLDQRILGRIAVKRAGNFAQRIASLDGV
jgi:hypothetical protein